MSLSAITTSRLAGNVVLEKAQNMSVLYSRPSSREGIDSTNTTTIDDCETVMRSTWRGAGPTAMTSVKRAKQGIGTWMFILGAGWVV